MLNFEFNDKSFHTKTILSKDCLSVDRLYYQVYFMIYLFITTKIIYFSIR